MDHQLSGSVDMTVAREPRADSPLTGQSGPNEKDRSSVSPYSPSLVNGLINETWFEIIRLLCSLFLITAGSFVFPVLPCEPRHIKCILYILGRVMLAAKYSTDNFID